MAKKNNQNLLLLAGAGVAGFFYLKNKGALPSLPGVTSPISTAPALTPSTPVLPASTVPQSTASSFTVTTTSPAALQPSTRIVSTPVVQQQTQVATPWGNVTPSNFNPVPAGVTGDVAECMKRKQSSGWSATTCQARLDALKVAINDIRSGRSTIPANEINALQAQIAAWNADNANLQAGMNAELDAIAKNPGNPTIPQWQSQIEARKGYITANNQRIAEAQAKISAQQRDAGIWQAALNNHIADYFALTGMSI